MELLTYESRRTKYTYYIGRLGSEVKHGSFMAFYDNGNKWELCFFYRGKMHGEYKRWRPTGDQAEHRLVIGGNSTPFIEMNEQEKLLFQIQHPGFRFIEE